MTQDIKAQIALIIEAIDDNELQYGRYDNAIKELLKELTAREEKLIAALKYIRDLNCKHRYAENCNCDSRMKDTAFYTLKELGLGE